MDCRGTSRSNSKLGDERRAEAASLEYSFSAKRHCCVDLMIVTVLVLVNDLGGND